MGGASEHMWWVVCGYHSFCFVVSAAYTVLFRNFQKNRPVRLGARCLPAYPADPGVREGRAKTTMVFIA